MHAYMVLHIRTWGRGSTECRIRALRDVQIELNQAMEYLNSYVPMHAISKHLLTRYSIYSPSPVPLSVHGSC